MQSYWQHCSLATNSSTCSQDRLPANLDIWSLLAASLAKSLPTSDEFDDSDAAVTAAVAFTIQVLKYPLEALRKGTSARERGAVVVSAEDQIRAMAWGNAWQALYQALTEVHHLRQKTISAPLLACMYEQYICRSVMATRKHTACNPLLATQWHLHGMACSASRFSICREARPYQTTCSSGDVTQAGLQAEQHRPASCLPAQACSRHASGCRCTLFSTSRGGQGRQSVPLEVSASSSCSGSGASGQETACCHFHSCICQLSMAE